MELSYVLYDDNGKWRRIYLREALRLFPNGSPYYYRRFKCGLCGQYITLASGYERQYFKHSSEEARKDCEERSFGSGAGEYISAPRRTPHFNVENYNLPLRIKLNSSSSFELEFGLIPVPRHIWSGIGPFFIRIDCYNDGERNVTYNPTYGKERLDPSTTTYLSLGSKPFHHYKLSLHPANSNVAEERNRRFDSLLTFWRPHIEGIERISQWDSYDYWYNNNNQDRGAIFSRSNGKKIPHDGFIQIGRQYYVLTNTSLDRFIHSDGALEVHNVCRSKDNWYVSEVFLKGNNENTRRFANLFHCQITQNPVSFSPIYPVCIEYPYTLRHAGGWHRYFIMRGSATARINPSGEVAKIPLNETQTSSLLVIIKEEGKRDSAQQMLALGNQNVLEYSYLWYDVETLSKESSSPPIPIVQDVAGKRIHPGDHRRLPQQKKLRITPCRDALLRITRLGKPIYELRISANEEKRYEDIKLGDEIEICYGLDVVWKASFITFAPKQTNGLLDDRTLYRELASYCGNEIPIDHSLGILGAKLRAFPLVGAWLRRQIQFGRISKQARERLLNAFGNLKSKDA